MSRNQNRKGGRKRGRNGDAWVADARDVATLTNAAFTQYYKGTVVSDVEWESFMEALRRPLPMAFRIHPSASNAKMILEYLQALLRPVMPMQHIPFLPGGMGLQCAVSRGDFKRSAPLKQVKAIITALNEGGYLTRQEAVSMIPVVLLQVQPGNCVLDMCAAPGSKTSQILEALISSKAEGVVVANDLNTSRLDVLLHQTRRSSGAHPHLIVTNYDAAHFPILPSEVKFDRVLCDVMCSGDGTLRKSIDMWPRWNTLQGADLHCSQVRVLTRGMMLCKKGGVVVYSTCSLNPVEDEAVVSECLLQAKGAFRLIDPTPLLREFEAVPGMTNWSLLTHDLTTRLHTIEEAHVFNELKRERVFHYHDSMFPKEEQLRQQEIHHTRRVMPHLQDTGGFFVAVMECIEEYPTNCMSTSSITTNALAKFEPFRPISSELQEKVRDVLRLPASFPTNQLFVRSEIAREQKFYFLNKTACALLPNLGSRVVHVGSKIFESFAKYSNDKLRFSADGVETLVPLLPSSFIVEVSSELLLHLSSGNVEEAALPTLPSYRSFLFTCNMTVVGPVYMAAERGWTGQISTKVAEWQVKLAKLTLGQPLVELNLDTDNNTGNKVKENKVGV